MSEGSLVESKETTEFPSRVLAMWDPCSLAPNAGEPLKISHVGARIVERPR